MPISDQVIELVPAGKSKSKLIIFIVMAAVGLALAATFLVLYLLKPSVEEIPRIVNDVTLSTSELFSIDENGKQVNYATAGKSYTITANVAVENEASKNVKWDYPQSLISVESSTNGESGEATIKFTPNISADGQEVTITATSVSDVSIKDSVTFKVALQGAESITLTRCYPTTVPNSSLTIENDAVSIPFYADDRNNDAYTLLFNQQGKYNPSTDTYLPMSNAKVKDENGKEVLASAVTVTSSDSSVVDVSAWSDASFSFRPKKAGTATVTITANKYNGSAEFSKQVRITVESNVVLGYADAVYVFNKPVVDAEFISNVIKSNGDIDTSQFTKIDPELKYNNSITLPYNISTPYADIYKHVLVSPISIQYDMSKKAMIENWYSTFDVSVVSGNAVTLSKSNGNVSINTTGGLASSATGASACRLRIYDNKPGSINKQGEVNVNIVAKNPDDGNVVSATSGGKTYKYGETVTVTPDTTSTISVTYRVQMPGNTDLDTIFEYEYLSRYIEFDFDPTKVSIQRQTSEIKIEKDKQYPLPTGSIKFVSTGGTGSSARWFEGTVVFDVKTAETLSDKETFDITFRKIGSIHDDDATWERTISYVVNKRATEVKFVEDDVAQAIITTNATNNERYAGKFEKVDSKTANIHVQNLNTTQAFESIYNIKELATVDDGEFTVLLKYTANYNQDVLGYVKGTTGHPDDILNFKAEVSEINTVSAIATLTVTPVGDTVAIGTLTVNIFLIDAITDFDSISAKQVSFGSSGYSNVGIVLDPSEVKVKRVFENQAFKSYSGSDLNLYYMNDDGDFEPFEKERGPITKFKYNGTEIFSYSTTTNRLTLSVDLMEFAYNYEMDFSEVFVFYTLPDTEFYVENEEGYQNKPFGFGYCTFLRKADDVAVGKDGFCTENWVLGENGSSKNVVNVGDDVQFYVASLFKVFDENADDYVWINQRQEIDVLMYEESYVVVDPRYNAVGVPPTYVETDNDNSNNYSYVSFRAQIFAGETRSEEQTFSVYFGSTRKMLTITVQNMSRTVHSIKLYEDEEHNKELPQGILFGSFAGKADILEKTIYVVIEYVEKSDDYQDFESVQIQVPSFLTVTYGGVSGTAVTLTKDKEDIKVDDAVGEFECVIALATNAVRGKGDITVKPVATKLSETVHAELDTGLKSITVTAESAKYDSGESKTIDISVTFALANDTDSKQFAFTVDYNALIPATYSSVIYNIGNLDIECDEVDGLSFADYLKNGNGTLSVNLNKLQALNNKTLKITFTDNTREAGTVFTLNLNVTVSVDIFALGFGGESDKFVMQTTGGSGVQQQTVELTYNNGNSKIQPNADKKNGVQVKVVQKSGNSYTEYKKSDFAIKTSGTTYTLEVSNSVIKAEDMYVRITYGKVEPQYKPIVIESKSHYIELASDIGMDLTQESENIYKAAVTVKSGSAGNVFKLGVDVKNYGTNDKVSGKTVSYGVYQEDYKTKAPDASVDDNGFITITPNAAKGTVYYIARYVDNDGSGKTFEIKVTIDYFVELTDIALIRIDENTMTGNTLNLYYVNDNNYTYIDLKDFVTPSNGFNAEFNSAIKSDLVIALSVNNSAIAQSGSVLSPKNVSAAGNTVTITATFGNVSVSKSYDVAVKGISALELNAYSGTVDITTDSSVTVTPTYNRSLLGLVPSYSLTGGGGNIIIPDDENDSKTLKAVRNQNVADSSYRLTATVEYVLADGSSASIYGGAITLTEQYTLTVTRNAYRPVFELYVGNSKIDESSTVTVASGATYKLVISNYDSNATYRISEQKGVLTFGEVSNGEATFTVDQSASGAVTVAVAATMFGNTLPSVSKNYTFTYGLNATAALQVSGGTDNTFKPFASGSTQAIDFDGTRSAYTFRYMITGVDINSVDADDIYVSVNGGTASAVKKGSNGYYNGYYVDITGLKAGTLSVGGYLEVGSRTVYLPTVTAILTTVAPEFDFASSVTNSLDAAGTLALSVTNKADGFMGGHTVTYQIISGNSYATLVNNGTAIKANADLTENGTVTVRATIQVTNGIYEGATYTVTKEINIVGKPLPTVAWNKSVVQLKIGEKHTYTYAFGGGYSSSDFTSYAMNALDTGLSLDTDFTFNRTSGELIILRTDKTKAGGKITLEVSATFKTGANIAHSGKTISDTVDIIIVPEIEVEATVAIGNAAASVDLDKYITVYTNNTNTNFINSYNSVVKSIELSDNDFAVNGTVLTLKQNVTSAKSVTLKAVVTVASGAYAGTVMEKEFTVNVETYSVPAKNATWNNNTNAYGTVDLAISGKTVTATAYGENAKYVTINGTTATVDRDANVYLSSESAPSDKVVSLRYIIVDGEKTYFAESTLNIRRSAAVNITVYSLDSSIGDSSLSKYPGDTFDLTLTADRSFDVIINSISLSDSAANALTVTYAGNKVMVTVSATASTTDVTYDVPITYTVGGVQTTKVIGVGVTVPTATTAYTANYIENEFHVNDNGAVTSTWTYNVDSRSQYTYASSITISAPNNLSEYFTSIELAASRNGNAIATANLSGPSATLSFGARQNRTTFYIRFVFNTAKAINSTPITATLLAYNSWGTRSSDVTIRYYVHVINEFTVNFDAGDDDALDLDSKSMTVVGGTAYGMLPTPTREYYEFMGWYKDADYEGSPVTKSTTVTANHTLYAKWEAKEYNITLVTNGGTLDESAVATVKAEGNYTLPADPTKANYTFVKWVAPDGTVVTDGMAAGKTLYTVLYAEWKGMEITVHFGGEGVTDIDDKTVNYNGTFGTLTDPERADYTFDGWYYNNKLVTEDTLVTATDNEITLIAKWTEIPAPPPVVKLDANGGTIGEYEYLEFTALGDFSLHTLFTPVRDGYTFDGWFDSDGEDANEVAATLDITQDTVIYAHWTEIPQIVTVTVEFDLRYDEASAIDDMEFTVGGTYGELPDPERAGYTFDGWYTTEDFTDGTKVEATSTVGEATKLFAKWIEDEGEIVTPPETENE